MKLTEEQLDDLLRSLDDRTRPELDEKILSACHAELERRGVTGSERRSNAWMKVRRSQVTKVAVAAAVVVAVLVGVVRWKPSIDGANVAWADVVREFGSISFFGASVYIKEVATDEPVQIEIWRNRQEKARIRVDSQVLFADGGDVVAGFAIDGSLRKLEAEEYDEMGMGMAQQLFSARDFSLDSVIRAFGVRRDRLEETTPLVNSAATLSEDVLVFDVQSDISPEWMRIWVLRESRLPMRIRVWDPRDGSSVDIVMSYSAEQSPKFFDPEAFERILQNVHRGGGAGGTANLAYALLKDPGGKDYTPRELFEKAKGENASSGDRHVSGYHLPQIEQAGVTEYGAVWVVASKSRNRKPDGRAFDGFSGVGDDLGRTYRSLFGSYHVDDDVSIRVWVPEGYPFDTRIARELTLRCDVPSLTPHEQDASIGEATIDEWQEGAAWPSKRLELSEVELMLRYGWTRTSEPSACEKILELVRRLDTKNAHAHEIEKIRLRLLIKEENYTDAAQLAERLLPAEFVIFEKAKGNADYREFYDYIVARAASGDVSGATKLFHEVKQLPPDLGSHGQVARKHVAERLQRQIRGESMHGLLQSLFGAGLDLEQVNQIVGFDVSENEDTKWYVPERFRRRP